MKSICAINLSFSIITVVFWHLGYRVNLTPSLPVGLYRFVKGPLQRGQIVAFCLDDPAFVQLARERDYLAAGSCPSGLRPLLKEIAGLAGDNIRRHGRRMNACVCLGRKKTLSVMSPHQGTC
jgi:conjugative transfer signal peptidase TraF